MHLKLGCLGGGGAHVVRSVFAPTMHPNLGGLGGGVPTWSEEEGEGVWWKIVGGDNLEGTVSGM